MRRLAARRGPRALSWGTPLWRSSGAIEEALAGDGGEVRDAALRRGPGDGWGRVLGCARGYGATASGNRKKRGHGRPDAESAKGVPKGDVAKADEGRVHQAPPCAAACRRGRRGPGIGQGATRRRQEALSQSEKRVVMREKATTAGIVHCFLKRFHTLVGGVCPSRELVNAYARSLAQVFLRGLRRPRKPDGCRTQFKAVCWAEYRLPGGTPWPMTPSASI